jgi:hypothetical protein
MDDPNHQLDGDLRYMLGRIHGQLTSLIALVADQKAEVKKELDNHDNRLRALERGKAWLIGAAAAVASVATFIINMVVK